MSRKRILKELKKFGEVIAIHFETTVNSNRLVFTGAGFVQFRHPSSLMKAVEPGQRGFLMTEETR
eukprot:10957277-Karenia_brevis.AAC.1